MILILDQLIYTSFPKIGFKSLASAEVSAQIQQAFVERIVYQYWDSYNPPAPGYQAAYLYQIGPQDNLFGWLYNDDTDELGRSYPYFICYYLSESLNLDQLQNILTCLQRGPIALVDRENPPNTLATIALPDSCHYQPARKGVPIASHLLKQSQITLENQELVNLFAVANQSEIIPDNPELINLNSSQQPSSQIQSDYLLIPSKGGKQEAGNKEEKIEEIKEVPKKKSRSKSLPIDSQLSHASPQVSTSYPIKEIVQDLVTKSLGIQGAVLVSSKGDLIGTPIGMEKETALAITYNMLSLTKNTMEEFNEQEFQGISVQSQEGNLILTPCYQDIFLLVKTEEKASALVENQIQQAVKGIYTQLNIIKINSVETVKKGNYSRLVYLLAIQDLQEKQIISLTDNTYTIGRSSSNTIVINSLLVSRQHALLLRVRSPEAGQDFFRIIDGNLKGERSSNGLFVNGERCFSYDLQHGDIIQFGPKVKAKYYAFSPKKENSIFADL